jgi:ABC-type sugar transport system ATPase subunit
VPVRLQARRINKSFGAIAALTDVSFAIAPGQVMALCGENGAGKSTLVKILTGVVHPDGGEVILDGMPCKFRNPLAAQSAGISFVSQELSVAPHLSVFDNIWLGHRAVPFFHRRRSLRAQARDILQIVGLGHVSLDTPASALPLGERQLLEIGRAIIRDASILFLDEPTATLSNQEIQHVFVTLRRLRDQGKSIVFITHRLGEVFDVCDAVTVLRNGRTVASGAVHDFTRDSLIEAMLGHSVGQMYPEPSGGGAGLMMRVRELQVRDTVKDVNFDLQRGQILCFAGQVGSGSLEIVRALAGLDYEAEGDIRVSEKRLRLGSVKRAMDASLRFVSEDRAGEGIFLKLDVCRNLLATHFAEAGWGLLMSGRRRRREAAALADMVQLDQKRLAARANELSGGNQQKIAVGRSVTTSKPGVLLMNEPTRGVDVGARAEIYRTMRTLCEQGNAIVMASTDIEEVVGISDVVITMFRGAPVSSYAGSEINRSRILADITHENVPSGQLS